MNLIGLMSGTSADGVDAAWVSIADGRGSRARAGRPRVSVVAHLTIPFPPSIRRRVLAAADDAPLPASELAALDAEVGERFAAAALAVARKARRPLASVRAIGSHGQTVHHAPDARPRVSMQLGSPFVIAERTGRTVVADFRRRDLAAGGQGAPLVPRAHDLLFGGSDRGRAILNLGGIANVTVLHPRTRSRAARSARATDSGLFAFDTGPANMVLDALTWRFTRGRRRFDRDGAIARRGSADDSLVDRLLRDPYFRRRPPKSTGRERFGERFTERLIALGKRRGMTAADLLATAAELTARSIADGIRRFVLPRVAVDRCFLCGGGVHNVDLVARLRRRLEPHRIALDTTAALGVDPDAVEAVAFALLARDTLDGRAGNVPRATGARGPRVLGAIVPGTRVPDERR